MPKKLTYEQKHLRNLLRLEKRIDKLFQEAAARVAHLSESVEGFSADDVFTFDKYPYLRNRADKLVAELNNAVETTIFDGVRLEWDLANEKNDALARSVLGSAVEHLDGTTRRRYFATNAGACEAFLARRERGLNLSERVWNLSKQFKEEMEMGLDLGLRDGISAVEMSRTLRRYLQNPTALFRRVRDEHGILHLSQRAAAYHPGRGVYRSAYKNARRLTATEVNIAYRTADHLRMQDLDFVVGVEIQLSENHTCLGADGKPHRFHDICDDLKGKYPKTFKFTGWHPHCRCYATPILKTEEEFDADTHRILQGEEPTEGSENAVDELPDEFKAWAKENEPRLEAAKARGTLPYFVRDNDALIDGAFAPKKKTLLEIAEERHAKRTKEEEDEIRQRWAARAKANESPNELRRETLQELKERMGEELPATLQNLDKAIEAYERTNKYGETARMHKDEIEDLMSEIFSAHDFGMNIELDALEKVHSSWFKNTFEVGESNGYVGSKRTEGEIESDHLRLRAAHQLFGISKRTELVEKQLKRGEYEKYGNLLNHDILASLSNQWNQSAVQYGDIEVRFKKDKVIATWTAGDSLSERWQPTLCSDPKACSFDDFYRTPQTRNVDTKDLEAFRERYISSYVELQYHGKLTTDCVESIAFPYDLHSAYYGKALSVAKKWKETGVKVFYKSEKGLLERL